MSVRSRFVTALGTAAVTSGLLAAPVAAHAVAPSSADRQAARAHPRVNDVPISFRVRNVNRSQVSCPSDGKTYVVRGHLVGPAALLSRHRVKTATLYLHGLSFGEFFWHYRGDRGRDFAAQEAARGHVSVTIDRLGYGSSDKPDGRQVCVGSRADMTHQMVQDLRHGRYQTDRGRGPRFRGVVLAGHSYGAQIAEVEAYSFGGIKGLFQLGYADRVQSTLLKQNAAYATQVCASGGLQVNAVGPGGYAPFGPPSGAPAALFHSAPRALERAVLQLLTIDPCGDSASFAAATASDLQHVGQIKVPVLQVDGSADKLFPPPAAGNQAKLFTHSRSVSHHTLRGAAHAYTFERGEGHLVRIVSRWLDRHTG